MGKELNREESLDILYAVKYGIANATALKELSESMLRESRTIDGEVNRLDLEIDSLEKSIKRAKVFVDSKNEMISIETEKIDDEEEKYNLRIKKRKNELNEKNNYLKIEEEKMKEMEKKFPESISKKSFVTFFIMAGILVLTILFYAFSNYKLFSYVAKYIILGVILVAILVFSCIELKKYRDKLSEKENEYKKAIESINKKISQIRIEEERIKESIDELNKEYPDFNEKKKEMLEEIDALINEEKSQIEDLENEKDSKLSEEKEKRIVSVDKKVDAKILADAAKNSYKDLIEKYESTCNARIWNDLDYIIDLVTTGVRENIKEAVRLIHEEKERERLNDSLKETIKTNADAIRSDMRQNTARITQAVNTWGSSINETIYKTGEALFKKMDSIKGDIGKVLRNQDELFDNQERIMRGQKILASGIDRVASGQESIYQQSLYNSSQYERIKEDIRNNQEIESKILEANNKALLESQIHKQTMQNMERYSRDMNEKMQEMLRRREE